MWLATALLSLAADALLREPDVIGHESSRDAFSYPDPALTASERRAFAVGNSLFKQNWVTAPSSVANRDGLGPLFSARSCSACHLRDGRSSPPAEDSPFRGGLIVRIGLASTTGPDAAHPRLGRQVQEEAIAGREPKARVFTEWIPLPGRYADGAEYELLMPIVHVDEHGRNEPDANLRLGARVAPQLIGLGLLEAIPDAVLLAHEDPADADGDGISGRARRVTDRSGSTRVGRFGWRASQPTVIDQAAAAFANDIGITSSRFPAEDAASATEEPEIDDEALARVALYTRSLAVPAPRDLVTRSEGRMLFERFRCDGCHVPCLDSAADAEFAAFAGRTTRAFTDLLLHDMGAALGDGLSEDGAEPSEWRTPPLWGIGRLQSVNGHERLLHDGRARGVAEAILWHGGEALQARESFRRARASERAALVEFVRSL